MANPQHEPTMEEILASIRKIISDDAAAPAATPSASSPGQGTSEPEVLDLTHEVGGAPAVAEIAAMEVKPEETQSSPKSEAPVEQAAEATATPAAEAGIFSEKARKALSDALSGIHASPSEPPGETPTEAVVPAAAASVEAVFERAVKEAFEPVLDKWLGANSDALIEHVKPVIRDWLDENFPALLEGAIRNELARAARPRSRR
ncbi:MAG TPA: DUF2497 domain-containing protein [Rhizomicrobium sp.]|nr:DUF2497 domain-containing protein [Rhizomicrobium sp.]